MALPPLFFTRVSNGGGEAIGYRLLAGTSLSTIPADSVNIGSAQGEGGTFQYRKPRNYMVEFGDKVFVWVKDKIYRINTSTDAWDLEYTITSGPPTTNHTGLYHIEISGVPSLIGFYSSTRALTYNGNTGVWSVTTMPSSVVYENSTEIFIYRNLAFGSGSGSGPIWWWDPSLSSLTTQSTSCTADVSFAMHKGVLYALQYFWADPSEAFMYRFTGAGWSGVGYVGTNTNPSSARVQQMYQNGPDECKPELVDIGGKLYAFVWGRLSTTSDSYSHLEVYEYDATGTNINMSTDETRLTSSVSPWTTAISSSYHQEIVAFQDFDTDPTNPETYFFINLQRDAWSWATYKWEGTGTTMSYVGAIGSWGLAPTQSKDGSGARIWTEGSPNVQITGIVKSTDGMTISFKAYGGGTGKIVKIYIDPDESSPDTQATLRGSATGGSATRNGNQVEGVSANGTTTYTVGWDFLADGLGIGEFSNLSPRIE